jgi:hypothetical protein
MLIVLLPVANFTLSYWLVTILIMNWHNADHSNNKEFYLIYFPSRKCSRVLKTKMVMFLIVKTCKKHNNKSLATNILHPIYLHCTKQCTNRLHHSSNNNTVKS